ncbi:MAG: hypothetical protein C0601_06970 [Candidatus Muiribacterium halophilum]|uniref:Uncharacterized protein n=1 Tax=Muiribacterium halophilum TaxID=2053465 RepID=A0A2N5ZGD7_MUIH1|nr:MAG: hypothetical protein C0601_06970 [Candidatus Muirbacterium halophilum]
MSIISSLIIFSFFLLSCGSDDNNTTELEKAVISENTKTVAQVKQEKKDIRKNIRDLLTYLDSEKLTDPLYMYKANKISKAKEEVKTANFTRVESPGEDSVDYYEKQKLNRIRDYYRNGDQENAFIQASTLLKNQTLSPSVRSELLFIMADLSNKNDLKEESLKFMDMAYEQMKKVPEQPDIQDKVMSQKELLDTFSELNDIKLYDNEEPDNEQE